MGVFQRIIFLFTLGLLPATGFAQFAEDSYHELFQKQSWIKRDSNNIMSLSSSYIASPYSAPLYLNTFILLHYNEDNLYQEVSAKLNKENYFGIEMTNTLRIWPLMDVKIAGEKFGLGFIAGNRYEQKIYFTNDFLKLMYEGNAPFAGQTAKIAPLSFRALNYQEVGVSMISKSTDRFNFGLEGTYLKGNNFYELNASRGTLFTSAEGDSVYADISYEYRSSDPEKKELMAFNGSGAGLSAFLNYDLNKKNSIFLALDELGFISWNNKSEYFSIDTFGSSTGFDFFDTTGSRDPGSIIDTVFRQKENTGTAKYQMWLKPKINMVYTIHTGAKGNKLTMSVSYRFDHYSSPALSLQYLYKPVNNFFLRGGVSYDEYKNVGGNLEMGFRFFKMLVVNVGSYHVEQFFTSMNGQSLYFGITGVFGK
jgi:hypothetical protein